MVTRYCMFTLSAFTASIAFPLMVSCGEAGPEPAPTGDTPPANEEMNVPSWAKANPGTAVDAVTGLPREVTDLATGIELVLIPAGTYLRGASPDDDLAHDFEKPRHEVRITGPFYLGKYEITNEQFRLFKSDHDLGKSSEPGENGDDLPAVHLSWVEAQAFSSKFGFRLPTEAEWEYACRAGSTTRFPWGDDPDDGQGWANVTGSGTEAERKQGNAFSFDDGFPRSSPVGSFGANGFGLHDMIGNVWEFCADWITQGGYDAHPEGTTDPQGPASGMGRALRGGSWARSGPRHCRSSSRFLYPPEGKSHHYGFRVARTP